MKELNHTFGDDGIFWMSYPDFLRYYPEIDRIRLISSEWTVTQQWTAVRVPYTADYLDTSFTLSVDEAGPVVLVLSQPDDRYFQGLTGRFSFELHFRVYKDGEETYLLRSMENAGSARSCSAELDLEPGSYTILVKITATRYASDKTAEEVSLAKLLSALQMGLTCSQVIKQYRESRRDKLIAVGKSFDAVHSKGKLRELEENDAKEERLEEKAEDKEEKIAAREQRRKERQRERARRLRREAEAKRKKDEKAKVAKEKRKLEKEAKKREDAEKKAKGEAEAKREAEKREQEAETAAKDKKDAEAEKTSEGTQTEEKEAEAGAEKSCGENVIGAAAEKSSEEKDGASVTTSSTAPGQPTPESTPSPSSDGKDAENAKHDDAKKVTIDTPPAENKEESIAPESRLTEDAAASASGKKDEEPEEGNDKDEGEVPAKEPGHDASVEDDSQEEQLSCHESEDEEPVSDCSSVADSDFSWDDAVDGSGEESSDSDADSDSDDLFKEDPWTARCVLGLRVCSLGKGVVVGVKHGKGNGPEGHENVEECG